MKTYVGERNAAAGGGMVVVQENGNLRALDPRYDLRNHSPTGFEWGYLGSGPSQLALAILADHFGDDERALELYQDFKSRVVSILADRWVIDSDDIDADISAIEKIKSNGVEA